MVAVLAVLAPAALALAGWAAVAARAAGSGTSQSQSAIAAAPQPSASGKAAVATPVEHWTVGKATGELVVRATPSDAARVLWRLPVVNANGYPQLVLVEAVRDVGGVTWYRAAVAVRPNGSHGWIKEGSLALYQTVSRIDIDLKTRKLSVFVRGELKATFSVGVGQAQYPTPRGRYFVNQKLRPLASGGPYGVLALGISAFQPKLANWPQGGPVAIHGTNQPALVGQPVSHGCIRMRNADILKVSALVPSGSPVFIHD